MPQIEQMIRLAEALALPGAGRALLTWKPFSITSFRMLHRLRGQGVACGTLLDGGANKGQFARAATETYPHADVLAFEPLPDVAEALRRNLRDRPQVRVVASALGSHDGYIRFHRHRYTLASSALPLGDSPPPRLSGGDAVEAAIRVPVARLDTLLADEPLHPPVLLKLDLQGYEHEALRGAPKTLARTDYVLLEVGFKPTYRGEATFAELYDHLRAAGFRFLRPLDTLTDAAGEITQMDVLFARPPAPSAP